MSETNFFLLSPSEICLKGKNRGNFEKLLIKNLKFKLSKDSVVSQINARILIQSTQKPEEVKTVINNTFGIAKYSLCHQIEPNLDILKSKCQELINLKKPNNFAIRTYTIDNLPNFSCQQTNETIGQHIVDQLNLPVNLKHPELTCYIFSAKNYYLVSTEQLPGPKGLPIPSSGHMLSLLSGGFDSPIAAHMMMSRGVKVDFIHFHSYPQTDMQSIIKVRQLVEKLSAYQHKTHLYLVPLLDLQRAFFQNCDHAYLVILYRRAMLRIANKIANNNHIPNLITGDSLGQVASQTQTNLDCVTQSSNLSIYRPLIGHDKEYIIDYSRKINTFDISKTPHQDCCSLLIPKHPILSADQNKVNYEEAKLANYSDLIDKAIKNSQIEVVE